MKEILKKIKNKVKAFIDFIKELYTYGRNIK